MLVKIKQMYEDKEHTQPAYPRIYLPIGSLYYNENDISNDISKYFVGTWVQVKDVFILAAGDTYSSKSSGGEANHTLTIDEIPSHNHTMNDPFYKFQELSFGFEGEVFKGELYQNHTKTTNSTGGSQSHNNMPPYYCVYCWKRVS